jgi:hypothetical protein
MKLPSIRRPLPADNPIPSCWPDPFIGDRRTMERVVRETHANRVNTIRAAIRTLAETRADFPVGGRAHGELGEALGLLHIVIRHLEG